MGRKLLLKETDGDPIGWDNLAEEDMVLRAELEEAIVQW